MIKKNIKDIGNFKFGKEVEEIYHKFDIDMDEKLQDILAKYGLEAITKDKEALINYAVNIILKEHIADKQKV